MTEKSDSGFVKTQNGESGIRVWSLFEGMEACLSGFHPSFDSLL